VSVLPLAGVLKTHKASFRTRYGTEVAARVAGREAEYNSIRNAVGLTDFSWVRSYSVPEEKGLDFLDSLVAGNVPRIRFGRVLHTFMADEEGQLLGDCFIANNDKEFVFVCESLLPDNDFEARLKAAGSQEAGAESLNVTHAVLSLDGYKAWEVARKLFGADVLGLPYLSIENYSFEGQPLRLLRAGKTSEFGYLLLAPAGVAEALFNTCKSEVEERGGGLCGVDIHDELRLEGRFFNVHAEGRRVRDPLVLGLQWMVDFGKESFVGAAEIKRRREAGVTRKLVGVAAEPGCELLREDAAIYLQGTPVAEVVASCFSNVLNQRLGLAIFPAELAYSGLKFRLGNAEGPSVKSISMPPIMPRSLGVKLDEV
jgi:aminomethyltransferase